MSEARKVQRRIFWFTQYRTSDVAENVGSMFLVRGVQSRGKTELILTRRPVEGYFGSEFRAICNHCGVMAARSRKTWKFCEQFLRFWKTTLVVKFSKICFERFHRLTDRRCCVQISWNVATGNRRNRALFTGPKKKQNFGCLLHCRYCADRAQNLTGSADTTPNHMLAVTVLQIFFRNRLSRTREHRFFVP